MVASRQQPAVFELSTADIALADSAGPSDTTTMVDAVADTADSDDSAGPDTTGPPATPVVDLVMVNRPTSVWPGNVYVHAGTGSSFDDFAHWRNGFQSEDVADAAQYEVADVDGDGHADLVGIRPEVMNGDGAASVHRGTGAAFGDIETWRHPIVNGPLFPADQYLLADVTGDGKADLVAIRFQDSNYDGVVLVYPSTGDAFGEPVTWRNPDPGSAEAVVVALYFLADMTGDGQLDLVAVLTHALHPNGPKRVEVWPNTGSAFAGRQLWRDEFVDNGIFDGEHYFIEDVTGDDEPDLVVVTPGNPTGGVALVYASNGTTLLDAAEWSVPSPSSNGVTGAAQLALGDADGDGDHDLILMQGRATTM